MLLNPDEAHSSKSIHTEYRVIHIGHRTLNRIAIDVTGSRLRVSYFENPVVDDGPVFNALLSFHLAVEDSATQLETDALLLNAMRLTLTRQLKQKTVGKASTKEQRGISLAQDFLRTHYAENVSLSQLAFEANLSPFYLLRSFHKRIGVPPHEYQTQIRVSRVKKLIQDGLSISQAAQEAGFFDQSHLTRNFKRIVGTTPHRYFLQSNIVQDIGRRV